MSPDPILASGVVLVRGTLGGGPEVLLIHRPRYDDWSIPKGKDDPGEIPEQAALRELHEETGYRAVLVDELDTQHYEVRGGPKTVRYFVGRPIGFDGFVPQEEVDVMRWVSIGEALEVLTYPRDRDLLVDIRVAQALRTGTVHLIRHGHAGKRSSWEGDDRLRPLSSRGRRQAMDIATRLAPAGLDVIHSSPYHRCIETVAPLAASVGMEVFESPDLAEGAGPEPTLELISRAAGLNVALCSHGDVIPEVVTALRDRGVDVDNSNGRLRYSKGSVWEITVRDGEAVSARYIPPV